MHFLNKIKNLSGHNSSQERMWEQNVSFKYVCRKSFDTINKRGTKIKNNTKNDRAKFLATNKGSETLKLIVLVII